MALHVQIPYHAVSHFDNRTFGDRRVTVVDHTADTDGPCHRQNHPGGGHRLRCAVVTLVFDGGVRWRNNAGISDAAPGAMNYGQGRRFVLLIRP